MHALKGKKVFVTGATGFIGANLVRRLILEGCEVHIMVRASSNTWRLDEVLPGLHVHHLDILQRENLADLMKHLQPHAVWNLLAYGAYPAQDDAEKILRVNILGTQYLLEALGHVKNLERFINVGSSSEYGKKLEPMREDMALEPVAPYGVAKAASTLLCRSFFIKDNFPVVILRPFSVFGPYEELGRLFPDIITSLLKGESPKLADPDAVRDFVHVDDVVDALVLAAQKPGILGEVFNIASGKESSVSEIFEIARRHTNSPLKASYHTAPPRGYDASRWVGDTSRSKGVLGWRPGHTLEEGIVKSISWFREHLALYPS